MDFLASSRSSSPKMFHVLIAICVMAALACRSVDAQVLANVTAGAFTLQVNLSSSTFLEELNISKSDFPSDFIFGVGTAAAQTEGSPNEGGRGQSVWDYRAKILPGSHIVSAVDGYKRYKEDILLIKDLGVNSYRFSISWTRILPNGSLSGGINQEGVDHYNSLIDELVKNGITPFVTILHFDLPQAVEDKYGGYLNRSFVDDFRDYSELCFKLFGDRVKHWFTFNEPRIIASYGYELGIAPPGRCSLPKDICVFKSPVPGKCLMTVGPCNFGGNSSTEPYVVAHNLILAHANVAKLYREKYQAKQKGEVGIVLVTPYYVPFSKSQEDQDAANRLFDFYLGWFMDPFVFGEYPKSMRELVKERLPEFTEEEKVMVKGSLDFLAINYYASSYAKNKPPSSNEVLRYTLDVAAEIIDGKDAPGLGHGNWPEGLEKLMNYIKDKYNNPKVYIAENEYPKSMRELVKERLPEFTEEEKVMVKGSLDFLAINYYASSYAKNKPPSSNEVLRYTLDVAAEIIDGKDAPGLGHGNWPEGLEKLMNYIKDNYNNPKVYIAENGIAGVRNDALDLNVQLNDVSRIIYVVRHLYRLNKAIKNGVNVKGYFHWTLMDDFEWGMGFRTRFGLYYVDFNRNYTRIPKNSVLWFHNFLNGTYESDIYKNAANRFTKWLKDLSMN
ncbi:beta-glucosidase 13-like [Prunus avium]|uniref:Beta-glucosidase 13-like n=1 Tax=Prunus avium TaxID=42229 RepID=A0A6P5RUE1_PRUAV|nr:beta-glucosidase 13-like [Prunus avium]